MIASFRTFPLSMAARSITGAVVAKSLDGRYEVWTHRFRAGPPGDRRYCTKFWVIERYGGAVSYLVLPETCRSSFDRTMDYMTTMARLEGGLEAIPREIKVCALMVRRESGDTDTLHLCGGCEPSIADFARVIERRECVTGCDRCGRRPGP